MRTLPPGMAAAIANPAQQPLYTVSLQDLWPSRYSKIGNGSPSNGKNRYVYTAAGSLIRALVTQGGTNGNLLVQRITNLTQSSQWDAAYTTLATGTVLALAGTCLVQQPTTGTIFLFYQRSSDNRICYRTSSNDGVSWSAEVATIPAAPLAQGNYCSGIAATAPTSSTVNVWAIYYTYTTGAAGLYRSQYNGTSWTAWASEGPTGGGWGFAQGVDAYLVGSTTYLHCGVQMTSALTGIASAYCTWNGTAYSATWTQLAPMDNGALGLSHYPTGFYDGVNHYHLALVADNGSVSGTVQYRLHILQSTDGGATWKLWQQLTTLFSYRASLLIHSGVAYVFDGSTAAQTPVGPAQTDVTADTLAITTHERTNAPSEMEIILDNSSGQYTSNPNVRADSTITLQLGYGSQQITTHSILIDSYTYRDGPAAVELVLQGRDYCKLLDYPQHRLLVYSNQTVGTIVQTICREAGVTLAALPGTSQFSQVVPCFMIAAGETWLQALQRAGAIYGFDFFADATPQIRVVERQATDPVTWSYGTEAFALSYGKDADQANAIRVVGAGPNNTVVFADVLDPTNALSEGRERFRNIVDRTLDTSAKCLLRGQLALREEQMNAVHGELAVTVNPQHELLDVVSLTDSFCGLSTVAVRIHEIQLTVEPGTGAWEHRLSLSGA